MIEIMVVVITLGVIASLALTNFNKVVEQSYCRTAQMNLARIKEAAEIYYLKNGNYHISGNDLNAINTNFKINIAPDPNFTYTFIVGNPWQDYSARAMRNGGSYSCFSRNSAPLGSMNPWCSGTNQEVCPPILQ